jgi:hypothetical protein
MNSITFTKENYGYEASSTIVIINSYLQFMTGSYCSLSLSLSLSLYIYIYIYMKHICMYVCIRVLSTAVGLCMMAMV